ncbi:MAG: YggT family protein [Clostridia bacterium]|nr:YggT family protein [Clostridia bacterium]
MKLFLVLTVNFVDLFLTVLLFAMLARALMSFFMMGEESGLSMILYYFTEPFILPVRKIFERLGLFQGTPMDVSFFFTTLLIGMVQVLLASIPM